MWKTYILLIIFLCSCNKKDRLWIKSIEIHNGLILDIYSEADTNKMKIYIISKEFSHSDYEYATLDLPFSLGWRTATIEADLIKSQYTNGTVSISFPIGHENEYKRDGCKIKFKLDSIIEGQPKVLKCIFSKN